MSKKLLRKKLALILATLKKKRPYYCEVEYLECNGTVYQWIDTGFKPTTNTKVRCILACADMGTANNVTFYGARTGAEANTNFGLLNYKANSKIRFDRGNYNSSGSYGPLSANTFYEIVQDKNKNYVDGVAATDSTGTFSDVNYNMFIFGINDNGTYLKDQTQGAGVWKESQKSFKLFQIYDNDVLVRDFIPVLDWNYVPCMYDKVSGQLFYNQGTGSFSYGREIHYVDYLESTGTQYIDTDYIPQSNIKIETDFQLTEIPSDTYAALCGSLPTSQDYSGLFVALNYTVPIQARTGLNTNPNVISTYSVNTDRYTLSLELNKLTINGNVFTPTTLNTWYNTNNSLYFFSCSGYNKDRRRIKAKIWYFKVYAGEALVRDYLPAIDENGVGFMFDRVTHTIYDNAGTGAFKYPARQLEYLESSRTQYIDTGISYPNGFRIKGEVTFTSISPSCGVFGSWGTSSPYYRNFFGFSQLGFYTGFGGSSYQYFGTATVNHKYSFNVCNVQGKEYMEVDGVSYPFSPEGSVGTYTSTTAYMFGFHKGSGVGEQGAEKLYWLKAYDENDNLVGDYVPVYQDGSTGMFNKVNNAFHTNLGTGTFVAGKVKEDLYI